MTNPEIALLMLGSFIFIVLLGFPIAFTLMAMAVGFGFYAYFIPGQTFFDNRVFYLLSQNTFSVMNNDVLTAVPLFLFMHQDNGTTCLPHRLATGFYRGEG